MPTVQVASDQVKRVLRKVSVHAGDPDSPQKEAWSQVLNKVHKLLGYAKAGEWQSMVNNWEDLKIAITRLDPEGEVLHEFNCAEGRLRGDGLFD